MFTLTTFIHIVFKVLATAFWEEKEIKGNLTEKEVKLSLFANNVILHRDNPKDATRKVLELNECGKVAGYKINTQKFLTFLYTNNKKIREIKEMIPFTVASKRIKYWRINLSKEAKDLYSENYKMLMKEIKDDTDGDIHYVFGLKEYSQNDYTIQSNLQIQCNIYQITNGILHRTKNFYNFFTTKIFTIYMET